MKANKETLLFLTRGNTLQIFDYQTEKVLQSYQLKDDKDHLKLNSFYSPAKQHYVTYGQKDLLILNVNDYSVRVNKTLDQSLEFFGFLGSKDTYCFYVYRDENQYVITLCKLGNELETVK